MLHFDESAIFFVNFQTAFSFYRNFSLTLQACLCGMWMATAITISSALTVQWTRVIPTPRSSKLWLIRPLHWPWPQEPSTTMFWESTRNMSLNFLDLIRSCPWTQVNFQHVMIEGNILKIKRFMLKLFHSSVRVDSSIGYKN